MAEKLLICIVGPTAIGKTNMAINLANFYGTEIISADSRQFYKEISIGTAVPSEKELQAAKHHFIQHKSIFDTYSVGDFERDAIGLLKELFEKQKVVIMVGGSGLYVDAVTKGLDKFPSIPSNVRHKLIKQLENEGIEKLQKMLIDLDPSYSSRVDLENPHRVIRALEVCLGSGKPYSSFLNQQKPPRPFKSITLGLFADRAVIYDRIEKRVDIMMEQGLLQEAREVYPHRNQNALQTIGYRELFNYFDETWNLDFAISEIKKNTRRFAKRQLTWFRKDDQMLRLDNQTATEKVVMAINTKLKEQPRG
ncbi:tRNA (adenosine(37)-N6)-dimethylallyltransferase MiaA [uncultured Kriegella sp.]|uniref:tRNA (adenosine(37)-N6)-dimethylallyltransferase MiaA n=1 Tax=uncultured Kriegella sp. TaxID=1798910 RepID=UPI0030D87F87|tara:strand:+ start:355390 stop:356313 length:924 start_codon:yes stop_codon:yes gene_type:complete